jgi:hypothetical protein
MMKTIQMQTGLRRKEGSTTGTGGNLVNFFKI